MVSWHFFEFMDEGWVPQSLRRTLRDNLEVANNWPFRFYYQFVTRLIRDVCNTESIIEVIELGAGNAPLTRNLVTNLQNSRLQFVPTDLNPDIEYYTQLQKSFPAQVKPHLDSVDFSKNHSWPPQSLLVLSTTFHHLPSEIRRKVLKNILSGKQPVIISESIRHNFASFFGCLCFGWQLALITPLFMLKRPGTLRRIFWCWLLPLAPLCFTWDGIISVVRCWSEKTWRQEISAIASPQHLGEIQIQTSLFSFALIRTFPTGNNQ